MIEPPLPPEKPISPNRLLILALGLLLSVGAGAGAAVLRQRLDASVRGVQDVRALLSVPPLAAIPHRAPSAEFARRRRVLRYSGRRRPGRARRARELVQVFVRPLDVVWLSLLRRFGM